MVSEGVISGESLRSFSFGSLAEAVSRYLLDDFILSLTTVRGAIEQLLTKASKEAEADPEDEALDVDSGFGELDEDDTRGDAPAFSRPRGVMDRDWRVYEVLDEMLRELQEKFKAIWA
jgi:hypothetical protein